MVGLLTARAVAVTASVALLTWGLAAPGQAEPTPSPSASTTAVPLATPSGTPAPSPTPASPVTTPTLPPTSATPTELPTATPEPVGSPTPSSASDTPGTVHAQAQADEADLTLAVAPVGGPVPGTFFEDLGSFGFSGRTVLGDGSVVGVQRRRTDGTWSTVARATVAAGAYTARVLVGGAGTATFRASAQGEEGAALTSTPVTVAVRDSTVSLRTAAKVDSLKNLAVRGAVVPARGGVPVRVDLRRGSSWTNVARTTTAADGTWSASLAYGRGELRRYDVRSTFHAENRARWELSPRARFARVAVLDAVVAPTTRADVAKTYRSGCPVGPSRLTTIRLNHYGRDKRMHRGVIIIRTDLRQEIIHAFGEALKHRYPVDKMRNPNAYGGNDPRQMRANNTSGFNCRKVVGNPYAMSPHSYGIALDVNTVQNPYRDSRGTWWPSNAKKYRDRDPLLWGMLGTGSTLTKSLRHDHFFWGGLWNPGRDYQHFEHRG